ncbi:Hypothetical predicted protein [Xyrichtys novacula]|uniref:Uncharacterized protein n=1 Tax=Xyrichtys novacula TaxID=13765 RepID=A0AAV1GCI7_XYRNO|nr:Hypothetical predicted protein [Xyrichtys novacula]
MIKVVGGNSGGGCIAPVSEAGLVVGVRGLSGAVDTVDASGCGDGLPLRSGAAETGPAEFRRTASRRNLLRAAEDAGRLSERWSRRVPGHRARPGTDGDGSPPPVPGHTGIPLCAGREVFLAPAPGDARELVARRAEATRSSSRHAARAPEDVDEGPGLRRVAV